LFVWYTIFEICPEQPAEETQEGTKAPMKKNDFILIGIVLTAALFFYLGNAGLQKGYDETVVLISSRGQLVYEKVLTEAVTEEFIIDNDLGYNKILIKEGVVTMIEADCPDQVCVMSKPIQKPGESIICLPHKVVVKIEGREENTVDAIAD